MRYRVKHSTEYHYSEPVAISHNVLHLAPRATANQRVLSHHLELFPLAAVRHATTDWYGNSVVHATVQEPHFKLIIAASSEVETVAPPLRDHAMSPPWERAAEALCERLPHEALREVVEFRFASPKVPVGDAFAELVRPSFLSGRPLLDAAADLTSRIHRDFVYDAAATDVDTPVATVLAQRRGVCQDFAHLMVAGLRSLGLAARYVSGYLETKPPPGQQRLIGADASHAWVQVYDPMFGWIDCDPTNGILPEDRHVTVAWGRDVGDVSPTKGMILGGGQHGVQVSVDVEAVAG